MNQDTNPREELYNRFRESLSHPVGDRFFDEDELVDIYDYAGDMDDDYVQLEVLLCGARLYPDSHVLAERKALLYLDTTDEATEERTLAASKFLQDNPEASSILFDIARLEVAPPENGEEALEFIFNQYNRFDDEEIIRFVRLALDLDCYQWLVDHIDELKEKVDFLPSLYYEVAREADDTNDNETLVKLSDALIELEPFASQYWMMLLRGQARLGKKEEATQTFEYALALAGDGSQALLALTEICYNYAEYLLPQMVEPLKLLVEANPDEFRYVDAFCAVNSKLQNIPVILETLRDFGQRHPENAIVVHHLLNYAVDDAPEYMARYFSIRGIDGFSEMMPDDVIIELAGRGNARELKAYIDKLKEYAPTEYLRRLNIILEFYYHCRMFAKVVELVEENREAFEEFLEEPVQGATVAYIYAFSLLKLKRHAEAVEFAKSCSEKFEEFMETGYLASRMTVRCLLIFFDLLNHHEPDDEMFWEYFDMLGNVKS